MSILSNSIIKIIWHTHMAYKENNIDYKNKQNVTLMAFQSIFNWLDWSLHLPDEPHLSSTYSKGAQSPYSVKEAAKHKLSVNKHLVMCFHHIFKPRMIGVKPLSLLFFCSFCIFQQFENALKKSCI